MDLSTRWIVPLAGAAALALWAPEGAAAQTIMDRARDRCARAVASYGQGWTLVDRERERELDDGRVQIRQRLRNGALVSAFDCNYDPRTDVAVIPSLANATYSGGQAGGSPNYPGGGYSRNETVLRNRARERCASTSQGSGWVLVAREREERLNDGRFLVRQRLRSGATQAAFDCFYDPRNDSATIPSLTTGGTGDIATAAREACGELARELGYRVVDRVSEQRNRERYEIRMRLRRSGRTESHDCIYNARNGRARIPSLRDERDDDRYGDRETPQEIRARSRCSAVARDTYRYEVLRVGDARSQGRDVYEVTLQVRRSTGGRAYDVECRYDERTGRVDITG